MKKVLLACMLLLCMSTMTGCYFWSSVESSEVGLKMPNGVSISEVVPSDIYTDLGWRSKLEIVDISVKTANWEGQDVWTSDKQPVDFGISISYSRDPAKASETWTQYRIESQDDAALQTLVFSRIPRVVKSVSTGMTLDEMLGVSEDPSKNREALQQNVTTSLQAELAECGIILHDVGINTIGVDPDYEEKLKQKSTAAIAIELATSETARLKEQLIQEQAQTDIDLEKARRDNLVMEETNKVYAQSPEAYELARLEALQGVLKDTDKVYFVPEGTDVTLVLGNNQSGIPIPTNTTTGTTSAE